MRLRISGDLWRSTLLTTLGAAACGGTATSNGGAGGGPDGGKVPLTGGSTFDSGVSRGPAGSGGTGGAAPARPLCPSPTPVPGGFESCANGLVHRTSVGRCEQAGPLQDSGVRPPGLDAGTLELCTADSDCTRWSYGTCDNPGPPDPLRCRYGCSSDAECGASELCYCNGSRGGTCLPATCRSDADCDTGVCRRFVEGTGCDVHVRFACGVPGTDCVQASDCRPGETCDVGSCAGAGGVCGRPFLIRSEDRRAVVESRSDWARSPAPSLAGLVARDRAELAEHWIRVALMEHASIAAFSRFTLDLIALGAPPELVATSVASGLDEAEHARLAFGLAASYSGEPVGPGTLSVDGALQGRGFDDIVVTAFQEACVGETVAAMLAAEQLEHATDPAVVAALRRIAADETKHAELGFRFVAWALRGLRPVARVALARRLLAEVEREIGGLTDDRHGDGHSEPLAGHGLLGAERIAAVRASALVTVVLPCARGLVRSAEESCSQDSHCVPSGFSLTS